MSHRPKLVVANWKMHGNVAANATLLSALREGLATGCSSEVAVCAPYPYLDQVRNALSGSKMRWGAQDVSEFAPGAHTGDVAVEMLHDFGCTMVIVGHSERRGFHAETDERCAAKALHAIRSGMQVVFCVGEKLEEREQGTTAHVVRRQLDVLLEQMTADEMERLVVAYEPIWAIGTGKTASPDEAQAVHEDLRSALRQLHPAKAEAVLLLYGGSVKPGNAGALFGMADIDGGLIGGASLVAHEFLSIVAAGAAVK